MSRLLRGTLLVLALAVAASGCNSGAESQELDPDEYVRALGEVFRDAQERFDRLDDQTEAASGSYRQALRALDAPAGLRDERARLLVLDRRAFAAAERFRTVLERIPTVDPTLPARWSIEHDAVAAAEALARAQSPVRAVLSRVRREAPRRPSGRDFAGAVRRLTDRYEDRLEDLNGRARQAASRFSGDVRALDPPAILRGGHERLAAALDPLYEALNRFVEAQANEREDLLVPMARTIVDLDYGAVDAQRDVAAELR